MAGISEPKELAELEEIPGMDWANDALFFTHIWRDETSSFDPDLSVRWDGGGEYYSREYKARVPIAFRECNEMIDHFLMLMMDSYPDAKGFWVD